MAKVKCETHGSAIRHRGSDPYSITPYAPVGHPESALICGATGCECAGLVWLTTTEEREYRDEPRKRRIFPVGTGGDKGAKVKVTGPYVVREASTEGTGELVTRSLAQLSEGVKGGGVLPVQQEPSVEELMTALSRAQRMSVDSVERSPDLGKRGVYAWYADDVGHSTLRQAGLTVRHEDRPVYIGKTLARRGFRQRVLGMHIHGNAENSTLRKTLAGVLKAAGRPPDAVSNYMHAHLSVVLLPVDDEGLIPGIERKLIKTLEPVLCVEGLETPNAERVRRLRSASS